MDNLLIENRREAYRQTLGQSAWRQPVKEPNGGHDVARCPQRRSSDRGIQRGERLADRLKRS